MIWIVYWLIMGLSYHIFAYYYKQLIPVSFYRQYKNRVDELGQFKNILDLGCGSGTLCELLKRADNTVTGLDLSEEMLMMAQDENRRRHLGIEYLKQDLNELRLHKHSYDLILCTLDTLNYLDTQEGLEHVFAQVSVALSKNGYFIFDVLTEHYFTKVVAEYYQSEELSDFTYEWYVKLVAANIIKHDLIIETATELFKEEHYQYLYKPEVLVELLSKHHLLIEKMAEEYNELDDRLPSRLYYYVRSV